ncbi:hypothetical protein Q3G72_012725 [Acer saccharum]|nr:hypothetical protein Q3G72_012725 [Acer saccharum]
MQLPVLEKLEARNQSDPKLKERRPLFWLKNVLDNAPPTKDFVGALSTRVLLREALKTWRQSGMLSKVLSTVQRIRHLDIKYMIKICKMLGLATLVEKRLRLILVTQRNSLKESVAKRSVRKISLWMVNPGYLLPMILHMYKKLVFKAVLVGESIVKQSDLRKGIVGLFGKDISS